MEQQQTAANSLSSYRGVLIAIALVTGGYAVALGLGGPQHGTELVKEEIAEAEHADPAAGQHEKLQAPPVFMIVPFVLLLGAIAVCPLTPHVSHWWENNLHKFYVAAGLAALTLLYYLFFHNCKVELHWPAKALIEHNPHGPNAATTWAVFANALLYEYVPFIVLLFSLYSISGGIRLEGDLPAHSLTNTVFLAVGAVLASIIGTTGAAMLLIRPLLETNQERKHVKHTVIFFIFIVCNCGGLLLPTGDPPLFLGYLMGVPFLWTLHFWQEWLIINGILLAIYFVWDHFFCYPDETVRDIIRDESKVRALRLVGVWPNALLLLAVIASVGLLDPGKPVLGTTWHPWVFLRELVQLLLVAASLALGRREIRAANNFNFGAIVEVAALFFGIFICMQPPLQILGVFGPGLGLNQPWQYFWASGSLSSFLDNAPTYVVFFKTANAVTAADPAAFAPTVAATGVYVKFLIAVSLGSVLMGANTYIGNGPNFMVKSIAESSGIKMPSFFGYMLYSVGILVPLFILVTFLFL